MFSMDFRIFAAEEPRVASVSSAWTAGPMAVFVLAHQIMLLPLELEGR